MHFDWIVSRSSGITSVCSALMGRLDPTPLSPAGQRIARATENFYEAAKIGMFGSTTGTIRQVMITTGDYVLMVHTVLQGVETMTLEQLAKGQDVFFRYYRLSPPSPMMPTGFAVVRILRNPDGQWRAQLRNLQGQLISELPASVDQQTNVGRVTLTGGLSDGIHYGVVTPQGLRIALRYPDSLGHNKPY